MVRPRVASVPSEHPYVRHLGAAVALLPDPPVPGAPPGQWWPPPVLDPGWLREHADAVDLVHTHFGLESLPAGRLEAALATLRELGIPLVHTVHDLDNPQLDTQAEHLAALDAVLRAAVGVVTLTPGAAAAVQRRWGREATVVPHPHVHPLDAPLPAGRAGARPRVGVHLRGLRPSVDGPGTVRTLLEATSGGADVEVRLHERVRDTAARAAVLALDGAQVLEAAPPDDAQLAAQLADLDATVLPYRHGTHSGWLELCWDLAVPVAVPADVGFLREQQETGVAVFERGDPASLAGALAALRQAGTRPGSPERVALQRERRAQRRAGARRIAAAHDAVYAAALRHRAR